MKRGLNNILGVDVKAYLQDFASFASSYNQVLTNYYVNGGEYPKDAFTELDSLFSRYRRIARSLKLNRGRIDAFSSFEVMDAVEDTRSILDSFNNYGRWMKSSAIEGRYAKESQVIYSLSQNQTIESMSRGAGYESGEKGFLDLTYKNKIDERKYDLSGGLVFRFSYQNDKSFQLDSIVDYMESENLLGKDICRKLQFVDDDLLALAPSDTFIQTCEIFTSLSKNCNPEFPTQGFDKDTLTNRNVLNNMLPTFIRQMYSVVGNDDTIASFAITNTEVKDDYLRIDMSFYSHLSTEIKQSVYGNSDL